MKSCFWFLQIEIVFIKWEENHISPGGTYINDDYIDAEFKTHGRENT